MKLLGRSVEDGASVDVPALALHHRLGARFGREDAVVAVAFQLRKEIVVKLFRLHFLQTDNVGRVVADLLEDALAPVLPFQHPTGAVAVHLTRRVFVAQDVVAHHREDACRPVKTNPSMTSLITHSIFRQLNYKNAYSSQVFDSPKCGIRAMKGIYCQIKKFNYFYYS